MISFVNRFSLYFGKNIPLYFLVLCHKCVGKAFGEGEKLFLFTEINYKKGFVVLFAEADGISFAIFLMYNCKQITLSP